MKRWLGLDLNGWHDYAARDWDPEEPDVLASSTKMLDGGLESLSVKQQSGAWVGGPQAQLAPHGRGAGWGSLGATERRRRVLTLWEDLKAGRHEDTTAAWFAAADALSKSSQTLMLTVPDEPSFDEAAQARTLQALKGRKRPRSFLLWRSVAVFLEALNRGVIDKSIERRRVRLLIHSSDGIEVQTLILRQVAEFPGHYAPERDGYGQVIFPELGLRALEEHMTSAMVDANPELGDGRCERSRLPLRLLFGDASVGETEVLRRNNGTWMEVFAPPLPMDVLPTVKLDHPVAPADQTILVSPLAPPLLERLRSRLDGVFPGLEQMPWQSIAIGALRAGRLYERGLPHYLDHLTPIHLAVLEGKAPGFRNLMPEHATVPANREYVSEPITGLRWGRGKTKIEFFVLKGDSEVRHWTVPVPVAPPRDVSVELQLRQTPGQSWARLSLSSPDWDGLRPLELEWDQLERDDRTPDEILATLKRPNPIVPERIVEPAHLEAWQDDGSVTGLASVLITGKAPSGTHLKELARAVRRSKWLPELGRSFRSINTDGELPPDIPDRIASLLDQTLETVGAEIAAVAAGKRPKFTDNSALIFVTWCFVRCPHNVQVALVETLENEVRGRATPLIAATAARTVVLAGAGRSVSDPGLIERLLLALTNRTWSNPTLTALAAVLSRREHAPRALASVADRLANKLNQELKARLDDHNYRILFKNALLATTGLLRYREVEPWALVRDRSQPAENLARTLEAIEGDLARRSHQILQGDKKLAIVRQLIALLAGSGGDPDLLRRIDELSDKDDEG